MIKPFKFLTGKPKIDYNGQMSLDVLRYMDEYAAGYYHFTGNYDMITEQGTYRIFETRHSPISGLYEAKVCVKPIVDLNMTIYFVLRCYGNAFHITGHIIYYNEEV